MHVFVFEKSESYLFKWDLGVCLGVCCPTATPPAVLADKTSGSIQAGLDEHRIGPDEELHGCCAILGKIRECDAAKSNEKLIDNEVGTGVDVCFVAVLCV